MGRIILEGMLFRSHIGVYEEEREMGNDFEVNVSIDSNDISGETDRLANTIDYTFIYSLVKEVMHSRHHLIEYTANELLHTLIKNIPAAEKIHISISKLNPPVGGEVRKATTELNWKA